MSSRPPMPELPVVTLTLEQQKLAQARHEYEEAKHALREKYHSDLAALKKDVPKCKDHVWVLPDNAKYKWFYGRWDLSHDSVYCAICSKSGGWYCPVNITRACEYNDDDYNRDYCIHCGQPDERK